MEKTPMPTTDHIETWKPCPGFEEWYSVSDHGRVRRDRTTKNSCGGAILKPTPQTTGYLCVQLFKGPGSTRKCLLVHRLVALAFLDPPTNNRTHVNHKGEDGDRTNNHASNLEWCTPKENVRHSIEVLGNNPHKRGLEIVPRGERHYRAKLTQTQVDEILAEWERSRHTMNQRAAARKYGVNHRTINTLVHGGSWRRGTGGGAKPKKDRPKK